MSGPPGDDPFDVELDGGVDDEGASEGEGLGVVTVPPLLAGVRVDRAVAMLAGVSRASAATMVAEGRVRVDGRAVTTRSTPLTEGSVLEMEVGDTPAVALEPEPGIDPHVVHADADVVVVDKPAGLVVHPGAGRARGTLAGALLARYPDLADLVAAGLSDPGRPGIVHRLDRGTSGLLVVARSRRAVESLIDQLSSRSVERTYVALVRGEVPDDRGVVDAPIGRSTRQPTLMSVSARGRPARTGYEVLRRTAGGEPTSLLEVHLETGRTHQIRVHMAAIGHPVVGDDRYGRPDGRLEAGRLFLHAARLAFVHPGTGARVEWRSPLPDDLAALVDDGPAWLGETAGPI
ncbi:MAG TPA: RluA family pseudouridine synthase [Acidimicrobiales bacterium]|nr:RluA family pseudouridine synthase [Acidimicrobiales bacterium]